MQIPVLNGVYADASGDFRTSYPRNMVPVPKIQGISQGYLRPADGIVRAGQGFGPDRGGINWNGICYRVMGSKLVSIDEHGSVQILGDVGTGGQVTLDYSFDRLAIASNGSLYYWDGASITKVTDSDLGNVLDFVWVDGYFMTTDGRYLIVTELNDPTSVNPLKYGSSEADPDPIKGVIKLRNEVYALNRYTIEVFDNVGGDYFPFERVAGAQVQRGVIGTFAAAVFMDSIAFLGGGRNEAPSVWIAQNGLSQQISTREIDQILQGYGEDELAMSIMEAKVDRAHQHLLLHLRDRTLVYDGAASIAVGEPVWFTLDSGLSSHKTYRARNLVWCYNKWLVGDPTSEQYGYLDGSVSTHFGETIGWEFGTAILYNEGMGAVFHSLELVCLPGRIPLGTDPVVWTSYTLDGETWSQERPVGVGKIGERNKRVVWLQQGHMRNWRVQRFRGTSDAHVTVARLEVALEGLNV